MEEVARCSVASERYWTEEKERALIAFYSKHSCLWNHKSEGYKNRQLRCKTLEHLRVILSSHPPPVSFTAEDIKNKFKNLRTTFQRQYKMVSACGGGASPSDEVFVSQWKYFHDLLFLTSYSQQQDRSSDDDLMFLTGYFQQQDRSSDDDPTTTTTSRRALQQAERAVPRREEAVKMENETVLLVLPGLPAPSSSSSSSSSPFSSNGGRCYWTEEKERTLISFYAEHGCLWNKKSVNHNNRQLRLRTLEILQDQLNEGQPGPFTVEDIKSKFNNLRTVFNREVKAVSAGSRTEQQQQRSDSAPDRHPYVSQWKHYDQLMFLLRESSSCLDDDNDNNDNDDETESNPPGRLQPLPLAAQEVEEEEEEEEGGEDEEEDLKPGSRGEAQRLPNHNVALSSCSGTQIMEIKLEEPDSPEPSDCHYLPADFHQSDTKTHIPAYIPASSTPCQLLTITTTRQERPAATLLPPTCLSSFAQGNNTGALNRTLASLAFPAMNSAQNGCARLGQTDTRCHWTEAKVCELISFYADHSCLWNHRSESYRNRERRQSTLEELSRQLSQHHPVPFTVEEIKTKFRNLRTIFQREHKAMMSASKANGGSEDSFCKPKWRHYRQLMFLCDSESDEALPDPDPGPYIGHLQEDGLLKLVVRSPNDRTNNNTTATTTASMTHVFHPSDPRLTAAAHHHQHHHQHHQEGPSSPTPPASFHSSPSSASGSSCSPAANHVPPSSLASSDGSRGPGLKRPNSHVTLHSASGAGAAPRINGTTGLLGTCCHGAAASPHAGFLKYVEECLNETPPDKVKRLKKMIIETIHSTSEEM